MSSEARQYQDQKDKPRHKNPNTTSWHKLFLLSIFTLLVAFLLAAYWDDTANLFALRRLFGSSSPTARSVSTPPSTFTKTGVSTAAKAEFEPGVSSDSIMKTPIYFLSHGGVSHGHLPSITTSSSTS